MRKSIEEGRGGHLYNIHFAFLLGVEWCMIDFTVAISNFRYIVQLVLINYFSSLFGSSNFDFDFFSSVVLTIY